MLVLNKVNIYTLPPRLFLNFLQSGFYFSKEVLFFEFYILTKLIAEGED